MKTSFVWVCQHSLLLFAKVSDRHPRWTLGGAQILILCQSQQEGWTSSGGRSVKGGLGHLADLPPSDALKVCLRGPWWGESSARLLTRKTWDLGPWVWALTPRWVPTLITFSQISRFASFFLSCRVVGPFPSSPRPNEGPISRPSMWSRSCHTLVMSFLISWGQPGLHRLLLNYKTLQNFFFEGYSGNGWKDGGLKRNVPQMKKGLQNIYFGEMLSTKKKPAKWSHEGEEDLPPWTAAERVRRQVRETKTSSTFFRRSWVISQEAHLCYDMPSVVLLTFPSNSLQYHYSLRSSNSLSCLLSRISWKNVDIL